jgi:ADP-heptose:LPS heptosyltransferase
VLLLSGPAEEEWSPSAPFDAHAHNQRLDRVAALLRRAHRYLGNDSGVSHLAGLAGCRGVVLFGPSDPDTWGPLGGRLCVVRSERPCATCGPDRFCVDRAPAARVEALLR